jgi:hypothetical protein
MSAEDLIARLDQCRPSGASKWIARCPAHDDKSPSLSISELNDGRVLIYCHAGCGANDVLDSVGLEYSALFPESDDHFTPLARGWKQIKREGPSVASYALAIAQEEPRSITGDDREMLKRAILSGAEPCREIGQAKIEAEKGQAQVITTLNKLRHNRTLDNRDHACARFAYAAPGDVERELRTRYLQRLQDDKLTLQDAMDDINWKLCNQIAITQIDREIVQIAGVNG